MPSFITVIGSISRLDTLSSHSTDNTKKRFQLSLIKRPCATNEWLQYILHIDKKQCRSSLRKKKISTKINYIITCHPWVYKTQSWYVPTHAHTHKHTKKPAFYDYDRRFDYDYAIYNNIYVCIMVYCIKYINKTDIRRVFCIPHGGVSVVHSKSEWPDDRTHYYQLWWWFPSKVSVSIPKTLICSNYLETFWLLMLLLRFFLLNIRKKHHQFFWQAPFLVLGSYQPL